MIGQIWETPRFFAASMPGGKFLKPGVRAEVAWVIRPSSRSAGGVIGNTSYKPSEAEVLFPPGTQFRVVDVRRIKGRYEIFLDEL